MNSAYQFYSDPDYLAQGFLNANYIWDPDVPENLELSKTHRQQADYTLRCWRDQFYHWQAGRYIPVSDGELKRLIKRHLHELNEWAPLDSEQRLRITSQMVGNILLCLGGTEDVHIGETTEPNSWSDGREKLGIHTWAFDNGLVMTDDKDPVPILISHTPRYFTLTKLPYKYQPDAACTDWLDFLSEVMEGDIERAGLLGQWAGYLLMQNTKLQKFLLIAGEGGNGKTVFTTVLERMLGEDNVTHVPLSEFAGRFALSATLGKVLNSTTESSHGLNELAETMLKSYTSGDRMTLERKYKEPIHARPTAKIMISTNQLPQFTDKSMGLWRRMLFVPFEVSFAPHQQDPDLAERLSRELPGIFNWALDGLHKLQKAGRFILPAKCTDAIQQYRRDVNPARSFLLDNYAAGPQYEGLPCREVYESYVTWCGDNGYRPLNASNFGKEVKRALPETEKRQKRKRCQQINFYVGLVVKEGSEVSTISSMNAWQT